MISKIVLALTLTISSSLMASEFNGNWNGEGSVMDLLSRTPSDVFMQVNVDLSEEKLSLEQCHMAKDGQSATECFSATYKVANESIYNQFDEKIGDIYPSKIIIFESNAQMSEQIQMHLNSQGEMRFNYSYSNLDGESLYKRAYLKKEE